ncbi:hypothetical protein Gotri_011120 [Gossypium trilobum]|uniref:NB-ARC domain-containing protein n=1 Tax=Gossypium trilobum TaxID=34281 RepID=A0A7J9EUB0_9ROSI|nr:hypothetical protein [Gossypium trilobum]
MEALKDYKVKNIVVWGMDGVGKTTLVKEVDHDVEGFDRVVMVIVMEFVQHECKPYNVSPEIIEVAKGVAKECGGLPLAIVPLARALRGKTLNGWKLAYHKISSSRLMDIEDVPKQRKEMHT